MLQRLSTLFALVLLGACAQPSVTPAPTQPPPVREVAEAVAEHARAYTVLQEQSLLKVFVMRGGPLSRFGHNHIIGGAVLSGRLALAEDLSQSAFSLSVDVHSLEVDRPQWRSTGGEDFASTPSDEDIAGTRDNMLGPRVLDASQYPKITIQSAGILGELPEFSVLARISLKDKTRSLPVPVRVRQTGGHLIAEGEFTLNQSEFGIEPFSILLGAISVQDELRVQYRIVAQALQ